MPPQLPCQSSLSRQNYYNNISKRTSLLSLLRPASILTCRFQSSLFCVLFSLGEICLFIFSGVSGCLGVSAVTVTILFGSCLLKTGPSSRHIRAASLMLAILRFDVSAGTVLICYFSISAYLFSTIWSQRHALVFLLAQ